MIASKKCVLWGESETKKAVFVNSVCFSFNVYNFLVYDLQNRILFLLVRSPIICLVYQKLQLF